MNLGSLYNRNEYTKIVFNSQMAKKIFIALCLFPLFVSAQTNSNVAAALKPAAPINGILVSTVFYEGDTIPYKQLPAITCSANRVFKTVKQKAAWDRLKYNVKKVYPDAILAAAKLKEYDRVLAGMPENQRKKYTKVVEQQLKKEFGDELKKLSVNQGRLLIKLIDRETGKTTYDVVKDMRGSFSAFMWQSVAIVFNSSLKSDYDPEGDDKAVEAAIRLVEAGEI